MGLNSDGENIGRPYLAINIRWAEKMTPTSPVDNIMISVVFFRALIIRYGLKIRNILE